jgi:hypothetical protein
MKPRMTSEIFVGRPIRAGDGIRPVKRNYASIESIDSGAKKLNIHHSKIFEKVSCRVIRSSLYCFRFNSNAIAAFVLFFPQFQRTRSCHFSSFLLILYLFFGPRQCFLSTRYGS